MRMFATSMRPLIGPRLALGGFPRALRTLLLILELTTTSLAIELLMAPPMAIYFQRITAVALPVNILIVPLLGILLPLALITLLLVLALPKFAAIPAVAVALVLHFVYALVQAFGAMRFGDLRIPPPQPDAIATIIAFTLTALLLIRMKRFGLSTAAAILCVATVVTLWPRRIAHQVAALEISTIDFGQGDSILVIAPHGKTLLIDAGGIVGASGPNAVDLSAHTGKFDIGDDVVSPCAVVVRYPSPGCGGYHPRLCRPHGGMPAVLANFRPRELWIGINPHSTLYDLCWPRLQAPAQA
jgi:competence protein ComEC